MTTTNQRWARERNFAKFLLKGTLGRIRVLLSGDVLTTIERDEVNVILVSLNRILESWKRRNTVSRTYYRPPYRRESNA